MTKNEKKGCYLFLYAVLSYPLNWLFLSYVFIPLFKSGCFGADHENWNEFGTLAFLMSPVFLPVEILMLLLVSVFKIASLIGPH